MYILKPEKECYQETVGYKSDGVVLRSMQGGVSSVGYLALLVSSPNNAESVFCIL